MPREPAVLTHILLCLTDMLLYTLRASLHQDGLQNIFTFFQKYSIIGCVRMQST